MPKLLAIKLALFMAAALSWANAARCQTSTDRSGSLSWRTISKTQLPSKTKQVIKNQDSVAPQPAPTPAPQVSNNVPVGETREGNRFVIPTVEIKRTPFQYVGRLFNERDTKAYWGTGTVLRGKKLLTARHLIEKLYKRADNNLGEVLLELPNGDRFRVTDAQVTGVEGRNMLAQDLAVARLVPVTALAEPTLLGGADWQEFSEDLIGSRVFLTGYDMDIMPQGRFELIGRIGSTQPSTIYRETLRQMGSNLGEGIASLGKEIRDTPSPKEGNETPPTEGTKQSENSKRLQRLGWGAKSFLGFESLNSAMFKTLFGSFGASQAYYFDDCVWLSSDMVCSTGSNGAPIWLQLENGRYVVIGVQSEPSGKSDLCGGTRIYTASDPEGGSKDSAGALIRDFN